jgi:hypothetical protein
MDGDGALSFANTASIAGKGKTLGDIINLNPVNP